VEENSIIYQGQVYIEEFRPVLGYEDKYEISSFGRVLSKVRKNPIIMVQYLHKKYLQVKLSYKGRIKTRNVHQLVAEAFLGHTPNGFNVVVDHIDNDPLNNFFLNLQLIDQITNIRKDRVNKNGLTGVYLARGTRWQAAIKVNKVDIHLGTFDTKEEANLYYENAKQASLNNEQIIIKPRKESSKYKNVSWDTKARKWRVTKTINGIRKYIGKYDTEEEARIAAENAV